ncbi:hypothetical protein [Arthrobacter globiformis]|uniref:hypothetical protein n=1 Tax=Arthrobacter globiformis TaxID=1665 RepID=UPI002783EF79|nr:hypothetical protein [Arthrobacter globiformis]MDQ0867448.1 hypothetical protein [Arthrobacter globiformis]
MTSPKNTIERILTEQDIPATLQADEELRAIAHSIARLETLREIYCSQLTDRANELLRPSNPHHHARN